MRLPKLQKWQVVVVEWDDSIGITPGWHEPDEDYIEVGKCVTAGLVFGWSATHMRVVLSRDISTGNIHSSVSIPCVSITKVVLPQMPKKAS